MQGQRKGGEQGKIRDLVRNELKRMHGEVRWNNSKMFSTAKAADQVNVYIDGQEQVFRDLRQLVDFRINNVQIVKSVVTKSPALPHIEMIDLKLNVFGPVEDQVYSAFPVLIKNIRRGNTVLRFSGPKGTQYSFGRKGLEKFFDMRYEFISPEQRYDDSCLDDEQHMHKNHILAGSLKAMLEGHSI